MDPITNDQDKNIADEQATQVAPAELETETTAAPAEEASTEEPAA